MSNSLQHLDCSTPGLAVHQQLPELLKCMTIELVMPFNHLVFCPLLLLLPSIFPSIRVFSDKSFLHSVVNTCYYSFLKTIAILSSVHSHSCLTLCDLMGCSLPGFPVHHQLPEFDQTHVHQVSDAMQPSHPLSSPSPPAFNLSQHQGLFH